ncbi:hypothetical protein ACPPVW_14545 [Leifsonia sp. McL0607]|uniref:hypothetical protein n=1 Tax=Leifsonia sp. McL0607 TaxID=3415672 RepID=UPI003CE98946
MFVEGTLRWQVTEDCPWDLLVALALRDLAGLEGAGTHALPRVTPTVVPVLQGGATGGGRAVSPAARSALTGQWDALFEAAADREHRPLTPLLQPPHFAALDRALELQDFVLAHHDAAARWARDRHAEYARTSAEQHAQRAADIVDVVHEREHDLRRQTGYFRLDLDVLPLAESGAWIVGPHTVVVSTSLREDSRAFRDWFRPLVAALV